MEFSFQVCTHDNNNKTISSVFKKQVVQSLRPPSLVSFNFITESQKLKVSWELTQNTNKYGVLIVANNNSVMFSKLVNVPVNEEDRDTVGYSIPKSDMPEVTNPQIAYKVQVFSVAIGNSAMDSLLPAEAQ